MTSEVVTSEVPGNTKAGTSKCIKARAFQFTLNQVEKYQELLNDLKSLKTMDYLISCFEEAPTTGHEHIHIYAHFNQQYKLSKKLMSHGAHIEICKGSPKQNIDYVKKNGKILDEIGEMPHQGMKSIKELREMPRDEVPPNLVRIYDDEQAKKRREESFKTMLSEIKQNELQSPEVIYFTGEPGVGKTYSAYAYALTKFNENDIGKVSFNNGFADFINPTAKCLICEEFRPADLKASKLLEFLDKYGASINVKGGFEYVRPKCIILASVFTPESLYLDDEKNKQFTRRITKEFRLEKDVTEIVK